MSLYFKTQVTDHICTIQLDRGKSNAMHLEMITELRQLLAQQKNDPAIEAIVLQGKEDFFSSGLDLITLFDYDEAKIHEFWESFIALIYDLAAFPKPSIAAITGHSPAGGCVLALCCDHRVMAEGDYIIGLNEVPVGIIVPQCIFELYSFWLGSAQASKFLLEGKLLAPNEALTAGLVDEVIPFNRIQTAAFRKAKQYMQYNKNAWQASKLNIRQTLLEKIKLTQGEAIDQVLKQWWAPATRSILQTIIENLHSKKS